MKILILLGLGLPYFLSVAAAQENKPSAPEFRSVLVPGNADKQTVSQQLIVDLEKKLWQDYQKNVAESFAAGLKKLNEQYQTAVYAAAIDSELAGNASSAVALAVAAEKKLIASGAIPVTADGVANPSPVAEIRKLRQTYAQQYQRILAERATQTKPLLAAFAKNLEKLEANLKLAEAKTEVALVAGLRARLPKDNGTRDLAAILAGQAAGTKAGSNLGIAPPSALPNTSLPNSAKELAKYLQFTVWDVKTVDGKADGTFRFANDNYLTMPWHGVSWRVLEKRSALMDNGDWNFRIDFSEDMKTLKARGNAGKAKDGWDGTFSKRFTSAVDSRTLTSLLRGQKWKLKTKDKETIAEFDSSGFVKLTEPITSWKKWTIEDGLLVISKDKGSSVFYLETSEAPSTLKGLSGHEDSWRLVGEK